MHTLLLVNSRGTFQMRRNFLGEWHKNVYFIIQRIEWRIILKFILATITLKSREKKLALSYLTRNGQFFLSQKMRNVLNRMKNNFSDYFAGQCFCLKFPEKEIFSTKIKFTRTTRSSIKRPGDSDSELWRFSWRTSWCFGIRLSLFIQTKVQKMTTICFRKF